MKYHHTFSIGVYTARHADIVTHQTTIKSLKNKLKSYQTDLFGAFHTYLISSAGSCISDFATGANWDGSTEVRKAAGDWVKDGEDFCLEKE